MSKRDWKKQLLRMKQLADQNLGRSEKSEVLTDDLQLLERQVNQIKDAWQLIVKRLQACLIPQTGEAEKRLRKLPEYAFTNCLSDLAATFNNDTILGKAFGLCSEAQLCMAKGLVQYSLDVEAKIIQPAQILLDRDIPAILKLRRQLANMTLDMDSAKSRYQALCKQTQTQATLVRLDTAREELDTAEAKVEHCKDVFATEMYNFFAREDELCRMLVMLMESQSTYHRQSLHALDRLVPVMKEEIELMATTPVFGCSLDEHLRHSKREIATVIEDCVVTIMRNGLDVEGIFRIAPGASKVKKLKAAFDANMVDADEYDNDIHCFCAALKHYLRELPQPIMTFELFNEWIQASQRSPDERLNALWVVVDKLPKHNYNNLRYLIKFLAKVVEHSEVNKMNASNLAIVIGPNLLWPQGENRNDIHNTSCLTLVTETLINSSEWFFPGEIDFPLSDSSPSSSMVASSSCDVSAAVMLQKSQAKAAFLSGNRENTGAATLRISSSANNLLDQSFGGRASVALTETTASNTFKPPKRIKKAAPAPPPPAGNHHQRSASVTLLTSMIPELASTGVSKPDESSDRKATTLTRPKVPPPARPQASQNEKPLRTLQPTSDECTPVKSANSSVAYSEEDNSDCRSEISFSSDRVVGTNLLDVPSNFAKKPVSRSLDDVVSESKLGEKYQPFSRGSGFENETVSDTEEVFSQNHASDLSSSSAFNVTSKVSDKIVSRPVDNLGPDEQAAVECLDNIISDYDPSEDGQLMTERKHEDLNAAKPTAITYRVGETPSLGNNTVKVKQDVAVADAVKNKENENGSRSCTVQAVAGFNVAVEPPSPAVSRDGRFPEPPEEGEPPYIDDDIGRVSGAGKNDEKMRQVDNRILTQSTGGQVLATGEKFRSLDMVAVGEQRHEPHGASDGSKLEVNRTAAKTSAERDGDKIQHAVGEVGERTEAYGQTDGHRNEVRIMAYKDRYETGKTAKEDSPRNVVEKDSPQFGTTDERERQNVRILAYKDRDKILNANFGEQQDTYRATSVTDSNRSFVSTSDASALSSTQSSNTSLNAAGSYGAVPSGAGAAAGDSRIGSNVVSNVKPSEHSEMVQSLKLFFLSDKTPASPPRPRSNSDLNVFQPTPVSSSSLQQLAVDSGRGEKTSARHGSTSSLAAVGSNTNAFSSNSNQIASSAASFRSTTDVRSQTSSAAASNKQEMFSSQSSSSVARQSEAGTGETAQKIARPGIPPPPPARRNRLNDSSGAATTRRSSDNSTAVMEDTRL